MAPDGKEVIVGPDVRAAEQRGPEFQQRRPGGRQLGAAPGLRAGCRGRRGQGRLLLPARLRDVPQQHRQRQVWRDGGVPQQVREVVEQPVHGLRAVQARAPGEGQAQRAALLRRVQVQVELHGVGGHGLRVCLQAVQLQRLPGLVVQGEQHLHERAVREGPDGV
ncbi:MAG: hypothetical protein OEW72_09655, partial [Gammaproteobacteria bacterium]|nr:hypothetical protein [Gammaproteobacteria bacterium]